MLSFLTNRIKALILTILNLFKRVLCIFHKRRRRQSGEIVMENVVIDDGGNRKGGRDKLISWNTWDDKPTTIEEHIDQYRKSLSKLRSAGHEVASQEEPDFFNDMAPVINTSNNLKLDFHAQPSQHEQKVTFEVQEDFNNLMMASPELGEILDEEEVTGWDADENMDEVLRQQRIDDRRNKRTSRK